ncbi:acyl--CoA ligase, partial [Staphylococcus epidermidis]
AIATYELYIAALKLGIAIIPSSGMLRTKDLQYRVSHGEIDAVISFGKFIKEFEGLKEYQNLTKFIVGDTHPDWISIEEEK